MNDHIFFYLNTIYYMLNKINNARLVCCKIVQPSLGLDLLYNHAPLHFIQQSWRCLLAWVSLEISALFYIVIFHCS